MARFDIPWLYLVFCYLLIIGMSNAEVNLTDGLDGLAAGTVMVVMIVMAAIAYRENMLPMAVFATATMAGACVGFCWFNAYPADIFMGDTGSLALGSALACIAIITKTEVFSLIIGGGLFVAEACRLFGSCITSARKALVPYGAFAPPLREEGLERNEGRHSILIVSGALAGFGFVLLLFSPSSWAWSLKRRWKGIVSWALLSSKEPRPRQRAGRRAYLGLGQKRQGCCVVLPEFARRPREERDHRGWR